MISENGGGGKGILLKLCAMQAGISRRVSTKQTQLPGWIEVFSLDADPLTCVRGSDSDGLGQTDPFCAQLARGLDNIRPVLQKSPLVVNQTLDHAANFLFASLVPQVAGNEVYGVFS